MNTIASSLDLWGGHKNFWLFLKKTQFSIKFYPLNVTSHMKSDDKIFLTLSTQDSKYRIGFSKFFWEHAKPDLPFQAAKMAFFGIFAFFQYF